MKKFFMLLSVVFLLSCTFANSQPTPTETSKTLKAGYLKTSLEVVRDGKTYDVVIGYDAGDGWRYEAPKLEYPEWFKDAPQAPSANIHWSGDIDRDGELEFIVELFFCGASCANKIQIYDYDPIEDRYRLFDEIYGALGEDYKDIDNDGNPEIISKDAAVFSATSTSSALSPILIYQYQNGKFFIATRKFPELVQNDANHWLDATKTDAWGQGGGSLTLASYLYDMYLLGKSEEGIRVFNEMCATYVKNQVSNPDFSCAQYLSDTQERILKAQENK